jgi:hypothetical protein
VLRGSGKSFCFDELKSFKELLRLEKVSRDFEEFPKEAYMLNELSREGVARSEICQKFACWRAVEIEAFTPRNSLATNILYPRWGGRLSEELTAFTVAVNR